MEAYWTVPGKLCLTIHHMLRHNRSKPVYVICRSFGGVTFFRHPPALGSAFLLYFAYRHGKQHS